MCYKPKRKWRKRVFITKFCKKKKKKKGSRGCQKCKKLLESYQAQSSLQASSPIWASEVSLARTRERGAEESPSRDSLHSPKKESLLASLAQSGHAISVKNVYNRVREWSLPWGCLHIKLKPFASVEPLPGWPQLEERQSAEQEVAGLTLSQTIFRKLARSCWLRRTSQNGSGT